MAKKRRLKIFPIFCIVVVIAVVVWAITLVGRIADDSKINEEEKNISEITDNVGDGVNTAEPDDSVETPEDEDQSKDVPDSVIPIAPEELLEEDKTVFDADAPKPAHTHSELLKMYPDSVLDESIDAGQEYIDQIVFIGDSTTHGMAFYGVLNGGKDTNQVWTPKSGTLAMWNLLTENIVYPEDDSEMLIKDAIAVRCPEIVVLTLGVNGVSSLSEEDFVKYYRGLIDAIKTASPNTRIILQSIYPVCDYYQYVNSISMEKINKANSWIAQLADDNGLYYLNTISVLVNEKGYLNDNYCNGDGIHISKEGFNVILDYIRTHAID